MNSQTNTFVGKEPHYFICPEPTYFGGNSELMKFLSMNIKYPVEARENGIEGTVIIKVLSGKAGQSDSIWIGKSVNKLLDAEALRVVKLTNGHWYKDTLTRQSFSLPVKFTLQASPTKKDFGSR